MLKLKMLSIMKTRLLKITLSFALTFLISAISFGQSVPFSDMTATQDGTGAVDDSVTIGKPMLYFVEPDPVLNSLSGTYDTSATNSTQGINSTFDWTFTEGTGTGTMYTPSNGSGADAPFRKVIYNTAGEFDLEVQEISAGNGCPGNTVKLDIEAIDSSNIVVSNAGDAHSIDVCETAGAQSISLSEINTSVGSGQLHFRLDISVDSLEADGSTQAGNIRTELDTIAKLPYSNAGTDVELFQYDVYAVDGRITRYTFAFDNSIDGTNQNGVNDYISRKSDYFTNELHSVATVSDEDFYFHAADAGDSKTITYTVYPTPQTGDIYYVPNDYDL